MNDQEEFKTEDVHRKSTRVGEGVVPIRPSVSALEAYSIKREIGCGGMAVVYEAIEKSLNRVVALKVLSKELSQDTDLIRRFVNEAQAAARLSHPNIVQIYSIGEEKGVYYFAMEYVRGQSVEDMLSNGKRISVKQCINIIRQTVLALQEAYKNNIIHRDIKPGNLLVTEQGVVKVADFGLAAEVKGAAGYVGGKIIGTPLYISPEQAQGKVGDFRSDIYSLGITFYQMLSGKTPFMSSDTRVLIKNHIEKTLPQLPQGIHGMVKRLVYRMTEKNPEKRIQDYELLIKEIDRINRLLTKKRYALPILSVALMLSIGITVYSFHYKPMVGEFVLPLKIEKERRIEGIYENVVKYARENPEAYGDIIREYFKIIKEYPDTEWAYRAEQKIDMIILAVAREASEELKGLKPIRDKLIKELKYKEAIDRYRVIKGKYRDTAAESFAQENIDYIIEEARKDFNSRQESERVLLNQYRFNDAREIYKEVISNFGLEEFVKEANDKLRFIDELEKEYKIETQAKNIFKPVKEECQKLLANHKYNEARRLLGTIEKAKENPVLAELVKNELARIGELEILYESTILKEKMESQYVYYNNISIKVENYILEYRYKESLDLIKSGINDIEILEWRRKLEIMQERLGYLVLLKDGIITGINKELASRKVVNISANDDRLIFIVEGGYVGTPWKESPPKEIYQIAKKYLEDNVETHMAFGIFCLTYKLLEDARKEFTVVIRMAPQMQGIVEKYLIQLAEEETREKVM